MIFSTKGHISETLNDKLFLVFGTFLWRLSKLDKANITCMVHFFYTASIKRVVSVALPHLSTEWSRQSKRVLEFTYYTLTTSGSHASCYKEKDITEYDVHLGGYIKEDLMQNKSSNRIFVFNHQGRCSFVLAGFVENFNQ